MVGYHQVGWCYRPALSLDPALSPGGLALSPGWCYHQSARGVIAGSGVIAEGPGVITGLVITPARPALSPDPALSPGILALSPVWCYHQPARRYL